MNGIKPSFVIEYTCLAKNGKVLASGKMRAKKAATKFEAQCGFEEFLEKKYPDFGKLIVIKCYDEHDFANMFNEILGGKNPFK